MRGYSFSAPPQDVDLLRILTDVPPEVSVLLVHGKGHGVLFFREAWLIRTEGKYLDPESRPPCARLGSGFGIGFLPHVAKNGSMVRRDLPKVFTPGWKSWTVQEDLWTPCSARIREIAREINSVEIVVEVLA